MKIKFFYFLIININLLDAQHIAFFNENRLLEVFPGYSLRMKSLDSLKLVLEQESKLLQEQNRIRVLELVGMYHISEEPLLDNLYKVLRNLDPKVYEQLKNEQEYLYKSLKAKELLYVQAYEKQLYPIVKNINQVVQDYCKLKGIKVLYKVNQLDEKIGYLEPQLDVTNELLNRVYGIK
jgi:Skp family chaperone for outer membrane proteins